MALRKISNSYARQPGVYIFRDGDARPIYVGKAKSLAHRLATYFQNSPGADTKVAHLLAAAVSIETIITNTEREAFGLEERLIKQLRPRYNVMLRDGKAYPYIRLTSGKAYPQVSVARCTDASQAHYYGPFVPPKIAHQAVRMIRRHFLPFWPGQPSTLEGAGTGGMRLESLRRIRELLEGRTGDIIRSFSQRMSEASRTRHFEAAAYYRNYIYALRKIREQARAARMPTVDTDVVGAYRQASLTAFDIFQFRNGKLAHRCELVYHTKADGSVEELLPAVLLDLYAACPEIPDEIHVRGRVHGQTLLEATLADRRKKAVRILSPTGAPKRAWLAIAAKNARATLEEWTNATRRLHTTSGDKKNVRCRLRVTNAQVFPQPCGQAGGWRRGAPFGPKETHAGAESNFTCHPSTA